MKEETAEPAGKLLSIHDRKILTPAEMQEKEIHDAISDGAAEALKMFLVSEGWTGLDSGIFIGLDANQETGKKNLRIVVVDNQCYSVHPSKWRKDALVGLLEKTKQLVKHLNIPEGKDQEEPGEGEDEDERNSG